MKIDFQTIEPEPGLLSKSFKLPTVVRGNSVWSEIIHGMLFTLLAIPVALITPRCSVILACNNHLMSLFPAFVLSKVKRKPCVVIVHHYDIMDSEGLSTSFFRIFKIARKMGYRRVYSLLKSLATKMAITMARSCEATICVSKVFAELFSNSYLSSNGVDLDLIVSAHRGEKEYEACFVGRLDVKKGILDLLQVWKVVVSNMPSARLALIGHDQIDIRRSIRDFGLDDNVIYLGVLSDNKMYEAMKRSRAFVTMSTAEGWGIAIAEALACGIPVVCRRIRSLYEQWKNCSYVFFTRPNDRQDAAETVIKVLKSNDINSLKTKECIKDLNWKDVALTNIEIIRRATNTELERTFTSHRPI